MSDGHRVREWKSWMSSYKQQVAFSIQKMQNDISVAMLDIQEWDSIKESLYRVDGEIHLLYSKLASCQTVSGSSLNDQIAVELRRQAIQLEIRGKVTEKSNLQVRLQSQTEVLQRWLRLFGNESYYDALGVKLQESKGKRGEMAQYQAVVRQAEAVISDAIGLGGTLSGNKYGSHIGSKTTAMKDQLAVLTAMQSDLLDIEKNIVICCRTALSLKAQIEDRIGNTDSQTDYGQKHR